MIRFVLSEKDFSSSHFSILINVLFLIKKEIQALEKNGTWEISELPEGKRPVGCKWIFSVKHNLDGSINRFKAQLVAKGFTMLWH